MLSVVSIPHSTSSLQGKKRLSIFISPLDLFWAVIKVHLPLRISIMISLTLVYMKHKDCLGIPARLLLNLLSCEFTQRHVWLMKVRIQYNIGACFTTLLWRGEMCKGEQTFLSSYQNHLKVHLLLLFRGLTGTFNTRTLLVYQKLCFLFSGG